MRIPELFNDELNIGFFQSMGKDLPDRLIMVAGKIGIDLKQENVPMFRLDVDGKYPPIEMLVTGHIVTVESQKVLYVQPQDLAAHAEELLDRLQITPHNAYEAKRLSEYCVLQAMVHLTLQTTSGLDDASREKILDQFTKDNY